MTSASHNQTFGAVRVPHTVIIARGDKVRYFTIRPFTLVLCSAVASALVFGSLGAAAYLAAGNDLPLSASSQETSLQHAYEDRIAALRTQLDRTVSRQMLDRRTVETKVDTLLGQQVELTARYEKLQPLFERARSNGLLPQTVPVPKAKPSNDPSEPATPRAEIAPLSFGDDANGSVLARFGLIDRTPPGGAGGTRPPSMPAIGRWKARPGVDASALIHTIGRSIDDVEERQIADLDSLADGARRRIQGIAAALRSEGIRIPEQAAVTRANEGGPFVAVRDDQRFEASFDDLDAALTMLQAIRETSDQLPLAAPLASSLVSSPFGIRPDPFFGRAAMHTGIDFVAMSGTNVAVTAPGKVIQAGFSGGYGQMVEVDHGGGLTSRYGHLSSILVSVGDAVSPGDVVGRVGTTGRSTGPHLHYEIRRDGEAVDPDHFLRAGRKIGSLG